MDKKLEKLQTSLGRLNKLRVLMDNTALSQLGPEQLCNVVMQTGQIREAVWLPHMNYFQFKDQPPGIVALDEVTEWWPAAFNR